MPDIRLRPRSDSLLRAWGTMVREEPSGPGFDFVRPRQTVFEERLEAFREDPRPETFDAIWSSEAAVEHANPGGELFRNTFDGDVPDLASFVDTLRTAAEFNRFWEERTAWTWALWELYTRANDSVPAILTSQSAEALSWFGVSLSGDFRDKMRTLERFRDRYVDVVGHATAGTSHAVPIRTELDELFRAVETVGPDDIAPQLKGPHGDFYRYLYGGSGTEGERTEPVSFDDVASVVRAYAWGEANDAYDRPDEPEYWGGTYWENWKETYADHVRTEIREQFALDDLSPDEIDPLFEAITDAEGSDLGKPVARYVMGSQWGQYTWNDVVSHFREHPAEASRVLSLFFDDSVPVVTRLEAFKDHTIHLTETEGRSPGSIERMATSLLMFTEPDEHLGLPPKRTRTFLEATSTLPDYRSGFRPRQYRTIINPLRGVRDRIAATLRDRGVDATVTMLDVHSLIWIYGGEGAPTADELPPEDWGA